MYDGEPLYFTNIVEYSWIITFSISEMIPVVHFLEHLDQNSFIYFYGGISKIFFIPHMCVILQ